MASIKVNGTKTISDLAAVTAINDADVFLIEVGGVTKKVTGATLKSLIASETPAVDNTLSITGDAADAKAVGDLTQIMQNGIDFNTVVSDIVTDAYTIGGEDNNEDYYDAEHYHGFKVITPICVKSVTILPDVMPGASATVKIIRYNELTEKYEVIKTCEGLNNEPIPVNMELKIGDGILPVWGSNRYITGSNDVSSELSASCVFDEDAGTFEADEWGCYVGSVIECVKLSDDVVSDVRVNGTSVVSDGVANVPLASDTRYGVVRVGGNYGLRRWSSTDALIVITPATSAQIKAQDWNYQPIVPSNQHISTFYGLAKAAGDTTQASSSNSVGNYTDNAKSAIKAMLGVGGETQTVSVSGTTPVIVANQNTRYVCGEVTSLDFTPSAAGICDVRFTSGSTVAVLTIPNTVVFPSWFDPTSLETNTTYEINIADGVYGSVITW